jgi:hypothetical protein
MQLYVLLLHCDNFSENAEIRVIFLYQLHHPLPDSHMIYTAPYVMFLMRADYEGKWEGVGPWKSRLFWAP